MNGNIYIKSKKYKNGKEYLYFEGRYSIRGKQKTVSCGKVKGIPPKNLDLTKIGNLIFEKSKIEARAFLEKKLRELKSEKSLEDKKRLERQITKGVYQEKYGEISKEIKINELANSYENLKRERSEWSQAAKTKEEIRGRILKFIKFIKNKYKEVANLSDIKAEMINSFRNNLKNKKYTGRTINEYLRILKSIFNNFCDWNTECINSLRKKEKVIYEKHDIFTDEEIESLIKKTSDKNEMEMKFLILIGYNTGLRLKDIVLLEWKNINLEKKLLTLKTSKTGGDVTL